jgi:P pilus assembly chaperone PapD
VRRAAAAALAAAALFAPRAAAVTGFSVSPLRLTLAAKSSATIAVRNPGNRPLLVGVSRAGFARTLRGRPRVRAAGGTADWLRIRPRRLRLAPHGTGTLRVTALPPSTAPAGDHAALVLLGTREPGERRVRVLLRVGVVVLVHVAGPTVRRLEPQALTVERRGRKRLFELRLANRGNVVEKLDGARLRLLLLRRGARVTLRARRLELLPHSAGIAEFVYRGRLRGRVVARVELQTGGHSRAFRLRL